MPQPPAAYSAVLRRLSALGALAWEKGLYRAVEAELGFHASRERVALASVGGDCRAAAKAAAALDALSQRCGRALVLGAGAAEPPPATGFDVVIAAGRGLDVAASRGIGVSAVVTDADGWATALAWGLEVPVLLHVHADNAARALHHTSPMPMVVLTGQVPWLDCQLAPLGFADGDRAVALAVALDCEEIVAWGVALEAGRGKFGLSAAYATLFLRVAGYHVEERSGRAGRGVKTRGSAPDALPRGGERWRQARPRRRPGESS